MKETIRGEELVPVIEEVQELLVKLSSANMSISPIRNHAVSISQSLRNLLSYDTVYASTVIRAGTPGNIVVGVTAYCSCGKCFTADVVAGAVGYTKQVIEKATLEQDLNQLSEE